MGSAGGRFDLEEWRETVAYKRKIEKDIRCPLEYGLDVFGGKWKSRILCVLAEGPLRYSELRGEMADISDPALAGALKELAADQLVARKQYEEIPPRVEYQLTRKGESVIPVLQVICKWSGIFYKDVEDTALAKCQHCDYHG